MKSAGVTPDATIRAPTAVQETGSTSRPAKEVHVVVELVGGLGGTRRLHDAEFAVALIHDGAVPHLLREGQERVHEVAQAGIPVVTVDEVEQAAVDEGVPKDQAEALADDYGDAQLDGLKRAVGAIAVIAALSFWFTRRLPAHPDGRDP